MQTDEFDFEHGGAYGETHETDRTALYIISRYGCDQLFCAS